MRRTGEVKITQSGVMYGLLPYVRMARARVEVKRCHVPIPVLTSRPPAVPDVRWETPACGESMKRLGPTGGATYCPTPARRQLVCRPDGNVVPWRPGWVRRVIEAIRSALDPELSIMSRDGGTRRTAGRPSRWVVR